MLFSIFCFKTTYICIVLIVYTEKTLTGFPYVQFVIRRKIISSLFYEKIFQPLTMKKKTITLPNKTPPPIP